MKPKKGPKDGFAETMESSVNKMEEQLELWAAQIDGLAFKAGKAETHSRLALLQSIDELKARRAFVRAKIDEFKTVGRERWEGLRAGIESAWSDFETAFRQQ
jgi:hypothetical protein